jgi:hypothetical protein
VMATFLDGPAAGASLALRRAPIFLRVVIGPRGKVDALDQLDDEPNANESVHVYRKRVDGPRGHVCGRPGGCFELGEYRYLPDAPGEELRAKAAWRTWVEQQAEASLSGRSAA